MKQKTKKAAHSTTDRTAKAHNKRLKMNNKNNISTCQGFDKNKRLGDTLLYVLNYIESQYIAEVKKEKNPIIENHFLEGAKSAFSITKNFFQIIIENERKKGAAI